MSNSQATDPTTPPSSDWGDPSDGTATSWAGWMNQHAEAFNTGVKDLKKKLEVAFDALKKDPGNPIYLGQYQSALSEYNMYRMLQSNSTKSLTDQSKSVIRNLA